VNGKFPKEGMTSNMKLIIKLRYLARLKHMLEIEPDQLGNIKEYILI